MKNKFLSITGLITLALCLQAFTYAPNENKTNNETLEIINYSQDYSLQDLLEDVTAEEATPFAILVRFYFSSDGTGASIIIDISRLPEFCATFNGSYEFLDDLSGQLFPCP